MRLRLNDLQREASRTIRTRTQHDRFRSELIRVLGPPVALPGGINEVAYAADEQLDLLESTGRLVPREEFRLSVLAEAANSELDVVRKLAARLLPTKSTARLLYDPSSPVRCAAANRLPHSAVKEAAKRYPYDDQLHEVMRRKSERMTEAPKKAMDVPFDVYGRPVPEVVKQKPDADLPESWYYRLAHTLCSHYGTNLEGNWEETLATRVAASHYATSGVKLDRDMLLKAIHDCIEEREAAVMGEGSIAPFARRLRNESRLDEAVMPVIEESLDPVEELLESRLSSVEYLAKADRLFKVSKSVIPAGVKKYIVGEGRMNHTTVPVKGTIPGSLTAKVERALDVYVEHWNREQSLVGEPYKLSWTPHPMAPNLVGFNVVLK